MRTEPSDARRTQDLEVLRGAEPPVPESARGGHLAQERRGQRSDSNRACTAEVGYDDESASRGAAVDVLHELHEARLQLLWLRARLVTSPSRRGAEHLAVSLRGQTDATEAALSCIEAVLRAVEPGP